ncbi:manganese efflux pump [Alicyclobacillus fastidiosus]|uniref:Manganese efflux pump n=1 Tax=Alicyclobacillus fastidiosus TaxID=392011 RepID=A0ABY6ZKQ9_9BACL|nr:manganese efflux pump [Alicyclobacillus fastidiosus]WAH42674.1 manganese efflux pump [Alicyclobacillus fastidiosus]GMA64556.1 sporulation membrane protein YtaF [Alicyclobacillus fastidiosus]
MRKLGWLSPFITANLIGFGSNLDNCSVGIAYGSNKIKFPHWVNAIVNAVGFFTTLLGAYTGEIISHYLNQSQASWSSCIVLVCIGVFFWYSAYIHPRNSQKQGLVLGLALSFTNLVTGFGATFSNAASFWATVASVTVWGYIMIWVGNIVGIGVLARLLGKYSSFVAGFLLISVGINQVY